MTKLTIKSDDFWAHLAAVIDCNSLEHQNMLINHIDAKLAEAYEQGKKDDRGWIEVSDRLPELGAERAARALVETSSGHVCEMTYRTNIYAKTEKGRAPRWEHCHRLAMQEVVRWMPLLLPKEPT